MRLSALTVCVVLAGACTPEGVGPSPELPPERTGGTIEVGIVGEPLTLDPYGRHASFLTYALVRPVFPTIFAQAPDGTYEPDLAESLSETGRGVRLTLEARRWSDGKAITTRDVAASIERATSPSGFTRVSSFDVISKREIELRGDVVDWEAVLSRGTFVLPRGRLVGGNISGGPFRFASYRRGRSLTYESNPNGNGTPLLEGLKISFVQGTDLLVRLLDKGEVDAAWIPSTVNLGPRLDELGLSYASAVGDERLALRAKERAVGAAVVRTLDIDNLFESFIRADGVALDVPAGTPGPVPSLVSIAVPEGDELLSLMQRAMQLDLEGAGVTAELITAPVSTFYGPWDGGSPADLSLVRTFTTDGPSSIGLASVATYMAWREKVHGIAVNPSLEGPLWNARDWWIEPSI